MITLTTPELPLWKVVPINIIQILDIAYAAVGTTRSCTIVAGRIRALPIVRSCIIFGLDDPSISVEFKGTWQYQKAVIDLGDEFDPLPWEW